MLLMKRMAPISPMMNAAGSAREGNSAWDVGRYNINIIKGHSTVRYPGRCIYKLKFSGRTDCDTGGLLIWFPFHI